MIAYVTKWRETKGVLELEGEIYEDKYLQVKGRYCSSLYKLGTEAFATQDAATQYLRKAAERKMASVRKRLNRLKAYADGTRPVALIPLAKDEASA